MSLEPEPATETEEPRSTSRLPESLAGLLRVAAMRGVCGGLIFAGIGLLSVPIVGTWTLKAWITSELLVWFPLGVWILAPTALVEGWSRGRPRWQATLATYLGMLVVWLLGLAQTAYARKLFASESPREAFLDALRMLGAVTTNLEVLFLLALLPLPFVLVSLSRLGFLGSRFNWAALALVAVAGASYVSGLDRASKLGVVALMAPIVVLAFSGLLIALYWLVDLLHASRWPPESLRDLPREPKPNLRWVDWVLLGGPQFIGSSLVCLVVGVWLVQVPRVSLVWSIAGVGLAWFLHVLLASNLAPIYLQFGWARPALEIARYHLRTTALRGRHGRLPFLVQLVLAHLRLRELEVALARLPEVTGHLKDNRLDRIRRLQLAAAFVEAGDPTTGLELVGEPPEPSWGRYAVHRTITMTAALWALERFQEGLDLLAGIDRESQPKRVRVYLDHNRAAFLLATGGDAQEALELMRAAQPYLTTTRGNLGVAMLHAGESLEEALEHIEAGLAQERLSPHGRTWLERHRAMALERLGRADQLA